MSQLKTTSLWAFLVICCGISGCGGGEAPPPLGEELRQQIEEEDKQIAEGESAL
ncbi:MAG: hypothetical protein ACF8AM_10290 [Rhodopirellula sp. JB055]|uniref:hypothetical protein n=1 Tax=Rhodopirellula sp. JB055 TaxID=3342846 RepID=UPI00370B3672